MDLVAHEDVKTVDGFGDIKEGSLHYAGGRSALCSLTASLLW